MALSVLNMPGSDVQTIVYIAGTLAKDYHHFHYTAAHLMCACIHRAAGLLPALHQAGIDVSYLEEWATIRLQELPYTTDASPEPTADATAKAVLQEATLVATEINPLTAAGWRILIALCTPGVAFPREQLATLPLTRPRLITMLQQETGLYPEDNDNGYMKNTGTTALPYLRCLTDISLRDQLPPVVGREGALQEIIALISRQHRPHVLITGGGGVGKTSLAAGLARAILEHRVPLALQKMSLYILDSTTFLAASTTAAPETQLLQAISPLMTTGNLLLFIDDLHLLSEKITAGDMLRVIKTWTGKTTVILIGTVTPEGFRQQIAPHRQWLFYFDSITLAAPDEPLAVRMITAVLPAYTAGYSLAVSQESIHEAVRLANRYQQERCLPDSALRLIDRTLAAVQVMQETCEHLLEELQQELALLLARAAPAAAEWAWFYRRVLQQLGPLLTGKSTVAATIQDQANQAHLPQQLQALLEELGGYTRIKQATITPADLATVVAASTGIPAGKIQTNEKGRLLQLETNLRRRVIGQDHAIKEVTDAILASRAGLGNPGKPIASFFFTGPTGTGKTALAKALADGLFRDEHCLIRFDMSAFKEAHTVALLCGAPPGYVGYEAGGLLINKIRRQPYAVVLFDEIEKAHPAIFDIFLQIMDEGTLHDRHGQVGDFSHALILFTSNIGSALITESFQQNVLLTDHALREMLAGHFRPEFLGRLTSIIPFHPVQLANIRQILDIQLQPLQYQLQQQGITLQVTAAAREYLSQQGYSPQFGVRPLQEVIRRRLQQPLSRMLLEGSLQEQMAIFLDIKEEQPVWHLENAADNTSGNQTCK
ncbi:AAA family ATPase [Chitinophaga nivalis]|uniref:ATP-dependent Clp protease ATP-binding subunit n=1 Tax=Chitinophaga nivalis TaxID=2991709 RepID=A0ABT3IRV1_9BACT|nr:ATP-dependent Clp protease ATP-binding subunit [Chitinophaga nivalis]MCW3463835.1 ATP-dependent Clp protease ATP-binding subunit [Chitinophaga nivalis]MCW3486475.1 ATP-dependent Clp protease ATP-binding subunit [Chitinophaga nivalis]